MMNKTVVLIVLSLGLAEAEQFTFTVFGDNRGQIPPEQPKIFETILREMNDFSPIFGFNTGDMILGYTADSNLIELEWDVYDSVTKAFNAPIYHVPGNHDIWDSVSYRIYKRRFGPTYYAFDTLGCLFIVLNTDEPGHRARIEGQQLIWFKNLLAESKGKYCHIFVFLHRPLFWETKTENWWRDSIHPMLVDAGVDIVFAGHWHVYEVGESDGVKYVVSGGAGAEIGRYPEAGYFHHYIVVTVDSEGVHMNVVKPGKVILPEDVVTYSQAHDHWLARSFMFSRPWIPFDEDSGEFCIKARNLLGRKVPVRMWWELPQSWCISPESLDLTLEPDVEETLCFEFRGDSGRPELHIRLPFHDTLWTEIVKQIYFVDKFEIPRYPLEFHKQINTKCCPRVVDSADFSGTVFLSWDAHGFRFRAELLDDSLCVLRDSIKRTLGDALVLSFNTNDPFDRYDSSGTFTSFIFLPDTASPLVERRYAIPDSGLWPVDSIRYSVNYKNGRLTYKIEVPWRTISTSFDPEVEGKIFGTILFFENDGADRECFINFTNGNAIMYFR